MSLQPAFRSVFAAALLWCCAAVQAENHSIPLFVGASGGGDPQGVLRLVNGADEAATVAIHAIDDAGTRVGPATLTLDALAAADFSATELQSGNAARGLPTGLGSLSGEVRLSIDTDLPVVPSAYVRNADGTLSAMNATVLEAISPGRDAYRYDVPVFHPASNATLPSRLRLINPGDAAARVTIAARDDTGAAATGGTVELTLPAAGARTLSSQQLEAGDAAVLTGRLGAGVGNWRLSVTSDRAIQAVNVTVDSGGEWRNLSTTAVNGWAPQDAASFEARFLGRTTVSRDGQNRTMFQVLADNRFLHTYMDDGVETRQQGRYRYERTGRDAGILRLDYDIDVSCEARFHFGTRISGWYAFACVDREDRVEIWTGNTWLSLDARVMPLDLGAGLVDRVYTAGTAIDTLTLPAASGGDGEFTYSLSPEVPGLGFDAATRELTGTPSETGVYLMTYRVRDASGDTDWRYFNIAVVSATGGQETTHGVGDTLSDLPAGAWTPDVSSDGVTFSSSDGNVTVRLDDGGYIEEGEYRYTCQSSDGCVIENGRVTAGTVVQTGSGMAPGAGAGGGVGDLVGEFDLQDNNVEPAGIAYANGRVHVYDWFQGKVYAYTADGERDAAADFDLHDDHVSPLHRIGHANERFYVHHRFQGRLHAYTADGQRDTAGDFDLHDDNDWPFGIAYANGRIHVVDGFVYKVFVYTVDGEHDAAADFDLHDDNRLPVGIAHADGRWYVLDGSDNKVYAYTVDGRRDAAADFDLHDDNGSPEGIAYADGRWFVLDDFDDKVYAYAVDGQGSGGGGTSPRFPAGSGPGHQTYTVGTAIDTLTLPEASGGDGPLTYSLSPAVPGLIFNATGDVRELSGTPSSAGTYDMTYRVRDTDGDIDSLTFTITVQSAGGGEDSDDYTPLAGLRVSAGRVQYGFFSTAGCIRLTNTVFNGVSITVHGTKWQRRDGAGSLWVDVPGTEQEGGLYAYDPTSAGEYRLVGEVTIDGMRGKYSSENTIIVN